MKTLFYTAAFGDLINFKMAENAIRSLRAAGYDRDVIVLTDKAYAFPVDLHVRVIILDTVESMPLFKMGLPYDVAKNYEAILFSDSDSGFIKNPESLFALVSSKPMFSRLRFKLFRDSYNMKILAAQEQTAINHEVRSVNSGTFLIAGSEYEVTANVWKQVWEANKNPKQPKFGIQRDQPALQAILVRKLISYDYIPDDLVVFPKAEPRWPATADSVVAHFVGLSHNPEKEDARLATIQAYKGFVPDSEDAPVPAPAPAPEVAE